MKEDRLVFSDPVWELIEPRCLGKPTDPGRTEGDCRLFMEAVLWIARTNSPWRDILEYFGKWNTAFKRFLGWVKRDVFYRIFNALSGEPDMEYAMMDATIVNFPLYASGILELCVNSHSNLSHPSWSTEKNGSAYDRIPPIHLS